MILKLSSCGSAQMLRNEGCRTSAGRVRGKEWRRWHGAVWKQWQNALAQEGQAGDTKDGVCLLSDKIGIRLKVAWVSTGRKRPAGRAKAVMKNWAREEQKGITQTGEIWLTGHVMLYFSWRYPSLWRCFWFCGSKALFPFFP